MALFGLKKKAEATTDAPAVVVKTPAGVALPTDRNLEAVLVAPHVTEKAVHGGERNVYAFEIHKQATKYDVADAVKAVYGVTPVKVNIVNKQTRQVLSRARGHRVAARGFKKAYVYLKKGDSINLV